MREGLEAAARHVMITGAAGFVGHHLARHHAARGDRLTLVDDGSRSHGGSSSWTSEWSENPSVRCHVVDLTVSDNWDGLPCEDVDLAYHLAAINGTASFYSRPFEVLTVNTAIAYLAAEWTARTSPHCRSLFASTSELYAGLPGSVVDDVPTSESAPVGVADVTNQRWSYAISKLAGEAAFVARMGKESQKFVLARLFNLYGPGDHSGHVVPDLIRRVLERQDPLVAFDKNATRSFCYIEDGVRALVDLIGYSGGSNPIFNVGVSEETSIEDLLDQILDLEGWRPRCIDWQPGPPGSVARRAADNSALRRSTGWEPHVSLREGLSVTMTWLRELHTKTETGAALT